ncbi:MAG TPA: valine--tRNA ligase [Xanthobacteraceae bacterium]|nr:valine--tRNA ligase [Xanthobacteraceae bacterium]
MIENRYQPSEVERRIYAAWEAAGAFRAGRPERAKAAPYCMVIPPPNVTGSLHMGHALNNTLQDILCRFERMLGKDVLWQPGTDHAGIATQAVVERQLMERQEPNSRAMGREAFIKRVWEWKAESGGTIISQLKRLGASCDWSRERFTMDEGLSRAVLKVFVALYREGLIYKDKRLVNWDPKLKTAISDLEVQQVETKGQLWHIKYPIEGSDDFIVVATTRPETMLGDVAVAVHPHNERLKHLIGKTAIVPLADRPVPIVGDEYADPEKGTGAVKITPAHDFNDYEVWQRHRYDSTWRYPPINVFAPDGSLLLDPNIDFKRGNPTAERLRTIKEYNGLDRFLVRRKIVERLQALELIDKIEPHTYAVPHGDRSNAVIEPYLTDQWYVDAKKLAKPAIEAVRAGQTKFVPSQWQATFFNWMENIQPWCISRQIWWGHQIPAWYGFKINENRQILLGSSNEFKQIYVPFVAESQDEALELARKYYSVSDVALAANDREALDCIDHAKGTKFAIWRDPDVLDTWFSSALWPFSTLGWPDQTPELKRFYPTSALVTGFDIIFFWVARMMMMGLHFMKEVPFRDVYIHALVRDERGQKMSKSKGNIIDPLQVIDEYGADALRFTLAAMAAQGRDIKLSAQRVEGYRNFATKLWNAARFAEINQCKIVEGFDPYSVKILVNKWIITQFGDTLGNLEKALDDYRFNDAANSIYQFVWSLYCDWYLELTKPIFVGLDEEAKRETRATVAYIRDQILKALHPFMPFVTEELWCVTESGRQEPMLALSKWPSEQPHFSDAHEEVGWLIELVSAIRSVRVEMNVPAGSLIPLDLINPSETTLKRARIWDDALNRLARISGTFTRSAPQPASVQLVVGGEVVALPLKGIIDLAAERARLAKEMAKCDADIARVDAKLGNPNFVARAPEDVVEEEKEKREEARARKAKIAEALQRLEGAV